MFIVKLKWQKMSYFVKNNSLFWGNFWELTKVRGDILVQGCKCQGETLT